jgi:hypothetical protein
VETGVPEGKDPPVRRDQPVTAASAVGVMLTTGRWRFIEPVDPKNCADPKVTIPPSKPTSH